MKTSKNSPKLVLIEEFSKPYIRNHPPGEKLSAGDILKPVKVYLKDNLTDNVFELMSFISKMSDQVDEVCKLISISLNLKNVGYEDIYADLKKHYSNPANNFSDEGFKLPFELMDTKRKIVVLFYRTISAFLVNGFKRKIMIYGAEIEFNDPKLELTCHLFNECYESGILTFDEFCAIINISLYVSNLNQLGFTPQE